MLTPDHILERFPKLSDAEMEARLEHPGKPVRAIIDTDAANEIDDQYRHCLGVAVSGPDARGRRDGGAVFLPAPP